MAKTRKNTYVLFEISESAESSFEKIKDSDTFSQVRFAAKTEDPKRSILFEYIIRRIQDNTVRDNVSLIKKRIDQALISVEGFTESEIKHYQQLFIINCFESLHWDNLSLRLEDLIRELHFFCKKLEFDLKTKEYDFLEDRDSEIRDLTETERFKVYVEHLLKEYTATPIEKEETLSERLYAELGSKGFFELDKVNQLSEVTKKRLVDSISKADLPHKIAMLDYLGFIAFLKTEHSKTYSALYKDLGKILSAKERAVKGNVLVLNPKSVENRNRYTAHKKKQVAKKDYERIKSGLPPTDCP